MNEPCWLSDDRLDALLRALGDPAGARPTTAASSLRGRPASPGHGPPIGMLGLLASVVLPAVAWNDLPTDFVPVVRVDRPTAAVWMTAPSGEVTSMRPSVPEPKHCRSVSRSPSAGKVEPPGLPARPVLPTERPAFADEETPKPRKTFRVSDSTPKAPRPSVHIGGGLVGGLGAWGGGVAPVGPAVRAGVGLQGPSGVMRPTMDATFEAAVLPGRLGRPDRFVGGVDGGVGVAVHLPRGRVEFVWTGGVRGVSVAPSGPGASASGTAFALTGPAVRTVVETPGPAVRLEVRGALTSVTTGKGAPPAPWVGLTLGLEGP